MSTNRTLFKTPEGGWQNPGRVVLNIGNPVEDLERIAESYELLANERVETLRSSNVHAATRGYAGVYPIVFLYRQALELSLKAIIYAGDVLLADLGEPAIPQQKRTTHPLVPLFAEVCRIFDKFDDGDFWAVLGPPTITRADLGTLVSEFDSLDKGSYAFRYTITTDGTTASLPRGFEFDLFAFAATMSEILPGLRAAPGLIRDEMQERWQSAYAARQEAWAGGE